MRIIHGLKGKGGELIPKLYGSSIVMEGYFKSHVLGHFLPRISAKLKKKLFGNNSPSWHHKYKFWEPTFF